MTAMSLTPPHGQQSRPAGPAARPSLTLAEEHVLVLWQVTTSAEKLLTAAEHGRWPGTELTALAGYARAEVLRQASDEEALLFPAVPTQTADGLARGSRPAAGRRRDAGPGGLRRTAHGPRSARHRRPGLRRPARAPPAQRGRPARVRPRGVPATMTLGGHPHEWYLLTEGPAVDLDALPPGQAVGAAVDRLLRMGRGEQVELRSGTSLDGVWREISELSPGSYQFTMLQDGPARWRVRVTRRQAAA